MVLTNLSNYVFSPAIFVILAILLASREKLEISRPLQACILNLLLIQVCSSIWFILNLRIRFNASFECIKETIKMYDAISEAKQAQGIKTRHNKKLTKAEF